MRRRTDSSSDSSLELLLDTICNTFGGILFISLLVVILLNTTSETIQNNPPNETTQIELIEAEIERQQLTAQLEQLKRSVEQQESVLGTLVSDEVVRLAEAVREKETQHAGLVAEKSKMVGEVSEAQLEINRIASEVKDRKARIAEARRKAAALEQRLEESVAARSKSAVIPKVSQTRLSGKTFFLTAGKLYGPRRTASGTNNTTDFLFNDRGGKIYVEPNPGGGVIVDPTGQSSSRLSSKFAGISPSSFFIRLFVWPDSYEHFEAVRNVFDARGLRYALVPCEEDTVISIGPASSGPSYVQ